MIGYPGSKAASGVSERIIREMPPHETYVEAFAGYAAVYRRKRLATKSVLIDAHPMTCEHLRSYLAVRGGMALASTNVICGDALDWIPAFPEVRNSTTLVNFDPPYLRETRTRLLYDVEFAEPESHELLLQMIASLPCMVMISGYASKLYTKVLRKWRLVEIPAMTRGGKRTECLWCNFPEPATLHDPRWAGKNYRDRERIKRKQARWNQKFAGMDPRERQAIAAALVKCDRTAVESAMASGIADPDVRADGA